jgi:hypothetical protein
MDIGARFLKRGHAACYDAERIVGRRQWATNGMRALSPGNVSPANLDTDEASAAQVYFTAGPNQGSQGLFGYVIASRPS